jgi:hypothetical protein
MRIVAPEPGLFDVLRLLRGTEMGATGGTAMRLIRPQPDAAGIAVTTGLTLGDDLCPAAQQAVGEALGPRSSNWSPSWTEGASELWTGADSRSQERMCGRASKPGNDALRAP